MNDALVFAASELLAPLLALGVFSALLFLWRRGAERATGFVRWLAFALLLFLILDPRIPEERSHPATLLVALESSASLEEGASASRRAWAEDLAARSGASLILESFAAEGGRDADPHAALARLLLRPRTAGRRALALFGSGQWVAPRGELEAPECVRVAPLSPRPRSRVRLAELEFEGRADEDEALRCRLGAESPDAPSKGVLEIFQSGTKVRELALELERGRSVSSFSLAAPPRGRSLLTARYTPSETAGGTAESVVAARMVHRGGRDRAVVIAPLADGVVARCLEVQGLELHQLGEEALDGELPEASVLVIDRIPARRIANSKAMASIEAQLRSGGGLLYLPPVGRPGLFDPEAEAFLRLLPLKGDPPPPPPPPKKRDDPPDREGLSDHDPKRRKKEKRKAPTLGLLLVIDASGSMKGMRLSLAKKAALAAANVLHPSNKVGVIAFNDSATVIRELNPAGDLEGLRSRVNRIRARGATDFKIALETARDVLAPETLGIKHLIFLSDGASIPSPLKPLVDEMRAAGITLSTVGCGRDFDVQRLSDLAAWGGGKFHPANSPKEVPEIFTVEVERVVKARGARSKNDPPGVADEDEEKPKPPDPKPKAEPETKPPAPRGLRLAWPSAYTRGIDPTKTPGLISVHPARPRARAWPSLQLEGGELVLAHGYHDAGRVACFTAPLEGSWAADLGAWDQLPPLVAQLARFLSPPPEKERFAIARAEQGRGLLLQVEDRLRRNLPEEGVRWRFEDGSGAPVELELERLGSGRWLWNGVLPEGLDAVVARVSIAGEDGEGSFALARRSAPTRAARVDLEGLEAWAEALGGRVVPGPPSDLDLTPVVTVGDRPFGRAFLPWLLGALVLEFLVRRLLPRKPRFVGAS